MPAALNEDLAGRLDEVAQIPAEPGTGRYRVQAYHYAATALRGEARPVSGVFVVVASDLIVVESRALRTARLSFFGSAAVLWLAGLGSCLKRVRASGVAQVSKPAVSPTSKSAARRQSRAPSK